MDDNTTITHWARIRCEPNVLLLPKTKPIYAVAKFGLNKPNSEKSDSIFCEFSDYLLSLHPK